MEIKTILQYTFVTVRFAKIKKCGRTEYRGRYADSTPMVAPSVGPAAWESNVAVMKYAEDSCIYAYL